MADWSSQTTHKHVRNFRASTSQKKVVWKRRLKIFLISATVVAGLGFSAKPVYRMIRENRINKNLDAAREAARVEDWSKTRDLSRSVLLARQGDMDAYRLWTRSLGKMGETRAYMAAAQLFVNPKATREDRLEAIVIMTSQAPQAVALNAYGSLPTELRNQPDFRASIAPLLVKRGEYEFAERGLREVSTPDNVPAVDLELIRVLCARPEPSRVVEARQIFSKLIREGATDAALSALQLLANVQGGLANGEPLPDLPTWTASEPKATTLHHLLALHPSLEAYPESADKRYEEAILKFQDTDPGILGTWLVRHNRIEDARKMLQPRAGNRSDAYIALLNVYLREGKEAELDELLSNAPSSVDTVEVEMIKAAIEWKKGHGIASQAAWTRALNQAAFDTSRNRFIEIARGAEAFGAKASAEDAWVAAVRFGWGPIPLYRDLLPVIGSLASKGRSEDLFAVCRTLQRFEPYNPEVANNVQYLGLIHGVFPPRQVIDTLNKLLDDHPKMIEIESALMLAEMIDFKPLEALKRLPKLKETRNIAPMMAAALEGTARVMVGETDKGRDLLKTVQWNAFMRQERIAFRDLLVKLKISGIPLPELENKTAEATPDEVPAWRKAVERMEKDRSNDILPALPAPKVPGSTIDPVSSK